MHRTAAGRTKKIQQILLAEPNVIKKHVQLVQRYRENSIDKPVCRNKQGKITITIVSSREFTPLLEDSFPTNSRDVQKKFQSSFEIFQNSSPVELEFNQLFKQNV